MAIPYYFKRHWRGQLPLQNSFWWIFVLPLLAVFSIPRIVDYIAPNLDQKIDVGLTVLFSAVFLCIYAWQVIGVLRAADVYARDGGDRQWALTAQGAIIISTLFAIAVVVGSVQNMQYRKQVRELANLAHGEKLYQLEVDEVRNSVTIRGSLEVGITRELRNLLETTPDIKLVTLNSYGGRVYEGRGLMKLIRDRALDTHVDDYCYSACAVAFVGGVKRSLGRNARLGFHGYKSYTVQPNINVENEQQKDMLLFTEQGIREDFTRKAYSVSAEDIWEPSKAELVAYSVLTGEQKCDDAISIC